MVSSSMTVSSSGTCKATHNSLTLAISCFLCLGLIISYLPQIIRIILQKSSLGFSPWFLLLGATSSASTFLNVVTLQWGIIQCCHDEYTPGQCFENLLAVVQTGLQWFLFMCIFVLFIYYYPLENRYILRRRRERDRDEYSRRLARSTTMSTTASTDGEDDRNGAESDSDGSSIGDIDSIGSHIAANYSTFETEQTRQGGAEEPLTTLEPSSAHTSSQERPLPSSTGQLSRRASAFSRFVPSFWPLWKGPAQQQDVLQQQRRSNDERQVLLQAPRGLRMRNKSPRVKRRTREWQLAIALAWLVALHFLFITVVTLLLVSSAPRKALPQPPPGILPPPTLGGVGCGSLLFMNYSTAPSSKQLLSRWATFLGLTGTILACGQYIPQLLHTYKTKLVGSLSIPMMLIQTPGSILFIYSLSVRPGIEFSSLAAYISTAVLQGMLLVMCLLYKRRQRIAGVDDFGKSISSSS